MGSLERVAHRLLRLRRPVMSELSHRNPIQSKPLYFETSRCMKKWKAQKRRVQGGTGRRRAETSAHVPIEWHQNGSDCHKQSLGNEKSGACPHQDERESPTERLLSYEDVVRDSTNLRQSNEKSQRPNWNAPMSDPISFFVISAAILRAPLSQPLSGCLCTHST